MYNLGSLVFGVLALILPFIAIARHNKGNLQNYYLFTMGSFGSCLIALCLQFADIHRQINVGDWTALIDTIATLHWVAIILALITLLLNYISFKICDNK
jgi:hypothetical protein